MNKDIVLLDLFSGIGGFSLGLTQAGFNITTHYYSEIDKHAIAIYKYQFKHSSYVGSVTTLDGKSITRPNIITFGSPCQDFSVAGKRAGLEGQRSSLIGQAIRLIAECRPDVFIWENVKGVFSSNSGEDFWAVIQAFANIGGYRLEWQLLNTAWVLPQNRERIYLIGHLATDRGYWQGIFPIGENNSQDDKLQGQSTNTLKARYEANGDGSYIIEDKLNAQVNLVGHSGSGGYHGNIYGENGVMSCLTGTDYKQPKQILIEPTHKHGDDRIYDDVAPTIQSRYGTGGDNIPYVVAQRGRGNNKGGDFNVCPTISSNSFEHNNLIKPKNIQQLEPREDGNCPIINARARTDGDGQPMINILGNVGNGHEVDNIHDENGIAPTFRNNHGKVTIVAQRGREEKVLTSMHDRRIRRLTEIECERLQGFPDNFSEYGDYDGVIRKVSKSQRYKCLGNAVTVKIVEEIGKILLNT